MQEPAVPLDELARLDVLAGCRIVDTPPEASFDDIARLAAQICDAPIALVSLVTSDRQWFKARVGMHVEQTSRRIAFCAHALESPGPFIVPNALDDERFRDNPLVEGAPNVRFYAGVPLRVSEGSAVGTLCVLDRVPRELSPAQLEALNALARHVVAELTLRLRVAALQEQLAPAPRLVPGVLIADRWVLDRRLGEGSVGAVFSAFPRDGGPPVALKFLHPTWRANAGIVSRFVREARILRRLTSPHVVRVLDVGNLDPESGGLPFIVTELLSGQELEAMADRAGRVPWGQAVTWVADACEGVGEAHALGLVHRDLKPTNIFLADADDGSTVVKVLDFGIAKDLGEVTDTRVHTVMGTLSWMAPEQLLSVTNADARSDVWALGAILHELVTGRRTFEGESDLVTAGAILRADYVPIPAVITDAPSGLDAVVARCLALDPARRPADARALRRDLLALLG